MRIVLQRVSDASVTVEGRVVGSIGIGFVLLVGFTTRDGDEQIAWMADKVSGLRLFADAESQMNLGLTDVGGSILVISQFTLYGDTRRGRRPSFVDAAPPEVAEPLYDQFVQQLRDRGFAVATGQFGAMMHVQLTNEGPVTLVLER